MNERIPAEALLAECSEPMRRIAEALRAVVKTAVPEVIERVRPGWRLIGYDLPVGRRTAYFCWIWPQPEHVHLGFVHGVAMDDPERLLSGLASVKLARWVTLDVGDPIEAEQLQALVREGARVARMSRSERSLRLHERGAPADFAW